MAYLLIHTVEATRLEARDRKPFKSSSNTRNSSPSSFSADPRAATHPEVSRSVGLPAATSEGPA